MPRARRQPPPGRRPDARRNHVPLVRTQPHAAAVRHGPAHCRRKREGTTQFPTIGLFERNANNFKGQPETRRLKNRGHLARNRKFESISLQQTVSLSPAAAFQGREPRFSARVWAAGLATGSAETRQTLHCGPTGCNISVGPYSSTAVPLRWSAKMPRRSRQSWVYSALSVRESLNTDRAQAKRSTSR